MAQICVLSQCLCGEDSQGARLDPYQARHLGNWGINGALALRSNIIIRVKNTSPRELDAAMLKQESQTDYRDVAHL